LGGERIEKLGTPALANTPLFSWAGAKKKTPQQNGGGSRERQIKKNDMGVRVVLFFWGDGEFRGKEKEKKLV